MRRVGAGLALLAALAAACTNNPYPEEDAEARILYTTFGEPPKTLDPQVAYSTSDHAVLSNAYETLLEYHFLKRPYALIPGLAQEVPEPRPLPDGRVAYRFRLLEGVLYHDCPCFALGGTERTTREMVADDVAFGIMRIADPAVNSPVIGNFQKLVGLAAFSERLETLRQADPTFGSRRIDRQYAEAGGIEGVRVLGPHQFEIVLAEPYPQILYWFAIPFTSPVPWEAVAWYDGKEGRELFAEVAVGTGPFRLTRYDKRSRIVLERNPTWYGILHPEWQAPGATYPSEGEPEDRAEGRLDPEYVGRPLPFLDRIELRLEKESIPAFTKFLQGYYDASGIIKESFDRVIQEDALSPDMAALGMRLERSVGPGVYYLGFNMTDSVVGAPAGERGRKLRQAMSLAVDVGEFLRIFLNGRGIPAQSPIPPGIFGFDEAYENPYRQPDLERAQRLLAEAGYPGGIDPDTGKPLRLTFDTADTSAAGRLRYQWFVDAWKRIGVDVAIAATNYNQFREKVRNGAYQLFMWGWIADYPDPENFLFLLWSPMGQTASGGPNSANFANPRYDELFLAVKNRSNDDRRMELIGAIRALLERERPWIELFHPEEYVLYHAWVRNVKPMGLPVPTLKYRDVEPRERAELRRDWNRPVRWPAYALGALAVLLVLPAIRTFLRERQ